MNFSLIPLPYRILGSAIIFLAYSMFVFYGGWKECSVREAAKQKDQAVAYAKMVTDEQQKGEELAKKLQEATTIITANEIERKKNVSKVTTGRDCLNSATLKLLRNETGKDETSGGTDAENAREIAPNEFASDTEVAEWAIIAQTEYQVCAKRLNSLIDWNNHE